MAPEDIASGMAGNALGDALVAELDEAGEASAAKIVRRGAINTQAEFARG